MVGPLGPHRAFICADEVPDLNLIHTMLSTTKSVVGMMPWWDYTRGMHLCELARGSFGEHTMHDFMNIMCLQLIERCESCSIYLWHHRICLHDIYQSNYLTRFPNAQPLQKVLKPVNHVAFQNDGLVDCHPRLQV